MAKTLAKMFPQYAIRHSIRASPLEREDVINRVAAVVGPKHKVNLNRPDRIILVEIYKVSLSETSPSCLPLDCSADMSGRTFAACQLWTGKSTRGSESTTSTRFTSLLMARRSKVERLYAILQSIFARVACICPCCPL
jgi:hypothetical protein